MTDREQVIATLTAHLDRMKSLLSEGSFIYTKDEGERIINALTYAIESLKVDVAYDLAYEKVDFIEIPDNATNGDMINALFPNAKNIRVDGGYPLNYIIEGEWHRNLKEWWNAPYKAESGE